MTLCCQNTFDALSAALRKSKEPSDHAQREIDMEIFSIFPKNHNNHGIATHLVSMSEYLLNNLELLAEKASRPYGFHQYKRN
jgi:hypothetical protein